MITIGKHTRRLYDCETSVLCTRNNRIHKRKGLIGENYEVLSRDKKRGGIIKTEK